MGLREATFITILISSLAGMTAVVAAGPPAPGAPAAAAPATSGKRPSGDPAAEAPPAADPAAEQSPPGGSDAAGSDAAQDSAMPPHLEGPRQVELGNDAMIDLPAGFVLFERTEAQELSRKLGNSPGTVIGMVIKPQSDWLIVLHYDGGGYIDDSDADELDADDLLDSVRDGTAEQNKTRKEMSKPELAIDGWTEKPRYERTAHRLVWGIAAHTAEGKVVNFLTRMLGRNGYVSVNLVADPAALEVAKQETLAILQATRFKPGSRFEDHVSSDHSSGVGLRGLVLGGAGVAVASKLGLLAKILLAFKKGILILVLGVGALFRRLFRRRSESGGHPAIADRTSMPPPTDPVSPSGPPGDDSGTGGPAPG